jgi:hypothetical protein
MYICEVYVLVSKLSLLQFQNWMPIFAQFWNCNVFAPKLWLCLFSSPSHNSGTICEWQFGDAKSSPVKNGMFLAPNVTSPIPPGDDWWRFGDNLRVTIWGPKIVTSDNFGTYCIIQNYHQCQSVTSDYLGFLVSDPVSKLGVQFRNWALSFETGTEESILFWNWVPQIGTVMIWGQKCSSFKTGQKSASSFETGTVMIWVLTYI